MSEQLVFDLPQRVALGRDMFLVADSNAQAIALIDGFSSWPEPTQWLYGPAGCGKTHLAAVLAQQVDAHLLDAADLADNAAVAQILAGDVKPDVVIIDGLDALAAAQEEPLFHLLNHARNGGVPLLLLSRAPAAQLALTLPDLQSRLKAVAAIELGLPDDALIAGLLGKLFHDRQLSADARVVDFLLPRIDRDYAAMGRLVADIDRAALSAHRALTVPLVAEVLQASRFEADED